MEIKSEEKSLLIPLGCPDVFLIKRRDFKFQRNKFCIFIQKKGEQKRGQSENFGVKRDNKL